MLDAHACNSNRGVLQVYNNMHISYFSYSPIFKIKQVPIHIYLQAYKSCSHIDLLISINSHAQQQNFGILRLTKATVQFSYLYVLELVFNILCFNFDLKEKTVLKKKQKGYSFENWNMQRIPRCKLICTHLHSSSSKQYILYATDFINHKLFLTKFQNQFKSCLRHSNLLKI
jgi:hypothetical protein